MTLLEVEELATYWGEHPPLHIMLAAYLGLHGPKGSRLAPRNRDPASLLAELGLGFGNGDVHAGFAPVVLDFAALRRNA
jgi:hypothetical protein